MVKLSFFHKDPPSKEEYIRREREHNEKKRKKFLEEQEKLKELESANITDDAKAADPGGDPVFSKKDAKVSLADRIESFRRGRRLRKEEKELKAFRKFKQRKQADEEGLVAKEKLVYGRELNPQERAEYEEYKAQKKASRKEAQQKRRRQVSTLFERAKEYGTKIGSNRNEFAGLGGGSSSFDFGSGSNILDVNRSIGLARLDFESNFGNLLGGKKARKKFKKHPLSI